MIVETITLHSHTARILWHWCKRGENFDTSHVVGGYPWEFVAEKDQQRVKVAFALAAIGQSESPVRYGLDPSQFGAGWIVETLWLRVPSSESPMIGISSTWSDAVRRLTPKEREVAKLLVALTTKEIAAKLGIPVRTAEGLRQKVADKVDCHGPQLVAWCQAHRDFL